MKSGAMPLVSESCENSIRAAKSGIVLNTKNNVNTGNRSVGKASVYHREVYFWLLMLNFGY